MKSNRGTGGLRWLIRAAACLAACTGVGAEPPGPAPLIPVESFARAPEFFDMQLSPDGTCIAYRTIQDESSGLGFFSVDKMKAEMMTWGEKGFSMAAKYNAVLGYQWVSRDRVVAYTAQGWAGADRDFSNFKFLTGYGRWSEGRGRPGIAQSDHFYPVAIVRDGRLDSRRVLVTNTPDFSNVEFRPDVLELNTQDGSFHVVEKNPGNVRSWGADWEGNVRFGLISDGVNSQLICRPDPKQPWGEPVAFGRETVSSAIAGLDADNRTLFVFRSSPEGLKALYPYDMKDRKFGGALFQHRKYDVTSAFFSAKHHRLLGVGYVTEMPRQYWFDPDFAKLQAGLDKANPGLVNEIVDMDWDVKKVLVFTRSAREAGYYTLIDLDTGKLLPIAKVRSWLKPEDMAEMYPVKCKARDGLELDGYLTLPVGRGKKGLPMVTFVHGGPFGVRDVWSFDPIVQFLANRGYAVLQVNYRGSGGYGDEFYLKGRQQVGGAIQDDIEDMTRWAVQQGVADPRRLAIMGGSYGGYSTLFALAHTPGLFRCGIAFAAVSDWPALLKYFDEDTMYSHDAMRFWSEVAGDMKDERQRQRLAAASPVALAAEITSPVLLVHGEEDTTVPIDQAHEMAAALTKAGHPPDTLYIDLVGHGWPANKRGVAFLQKLESFLAANMAK